MSFFQGNNRFRPAGSSAKGLRAIGLMSCLTLFAALSGAETYIIPHMPVGGGWSTRLLFATTGTADVTADVTFFAQNGTLGSVTIEG
jgi:hypothetical protein